MSTGHHDLPRGPAGQKAARRAAAARRRRILLNNDGNEPVYLAKEPTEEALLAPRTAALAGSQVDAVFHCTWSSGFGLFTHFTRTGQVFTATEAMFAVNRMPQLLEAGVDPLSVMCRFCRAHGMEIFWSMRMNDTHDGSTADYGPVMFRANRLKNDHPEFLLGNPGNRPRYGAWSAVNYAIDDIRDLAFRYVEEVCRGYDVDGVELDFFRHPVFFRGPSLGFPATERELDLMTGLLRRIRAMMDGEGARRGRPLLLAVRAPDDVAFAGKVGLDVERWLAEGLVDILIPSGYIQLNRWEYSVRLAHRYGVPVYPALDESRVREEGTMDVTLGEFTRARGIPDAYRARAANVWAAGADGVYLYNYFNPRSPILREIGDPTTLRGRDKLYFASVRGVGRVAGDCLPHETHIAVETLNPQHPRELYRSSPESVDVLVGEDLADAARSGWRALPALRLQVAGPGGAVEPARIETAFNGVVLPAPGACGLFLEYPLDPSAIRRGDNEVRVVSVDDGKSCPPLLLEDVQIRIRYERA